MTEAPRTRRSELSDLVLRRRTELGLSRRTMANLTADDAGALVIKASWLERLEKNLPVHTPQALELQAMADALRLPSQLLKEAAAAQFLDWDGGAAWSQDGTVRLVVAHMEELTPEQRRDLAEQAELWARQLKRRKHET